MLMTWKGPFSVITFYPPEQSDLWNWKPIRIFHPFLKKGFMTFFKKYKKIREKETSLKLG